MPISGHTKEVPAERAARSTRLADHEGTTADVRYHKNGVATAAKAGDSSAHLECVRGPTDDLDRGLTEILAGRKNMKYLQNVRNTRTPRSVVLLAVALLGTGFAAAVYRRRKKQ